MIYSVRCADNYHEDGRRIDEDRRHGNEVSGPSKIALIF